MASAKQNTAWVSLSLYLCHLRYLEILWRILKQTFRRYNLRSVQLGNITAQNRHLKVAKAIINIITRCPEDGWERRLVGK